VALAHVCCECSGFAFLVALTPPPNDTQNGSQQPIVAAMFQTATTQLAERDQALSTANDFKGALRVSLLNKNEIAGSTKGESDASGQFGLTRGFACVWVTFSLVLFYNVIVLSSVRPLIGQHWRVPVVCWRAHNVTENSSCPTAMQYAVLQKPSARYCSELPSLVHTDPVHSLPYSVSHVQRCPCCRHRATKTHATIKMLKAVTDERKGKVALCTPSSHIEVVWVQLRSF
jgi:hypothetical protein